MQNFWSRYLNQTLLESNRGKDVESFLELLSNVVPDFLLISHFTFLPTLVGRNREIKLNNYFGKEIFQVLSKRDEHFGMEIKYKRLNQNTEGL